MNTESPGRLQAAAAESRQARQTIADVLRYHLSLPNGFSVSIVHAPGHLHDDVTVNDVVGDWLEVIDRKGEHVFVNLNLVSYLTIHED